MFGFEKQEIFERQVDVYKQLLSLKTVECESLREQLKEAIKDRDFYREELFKLKGIGQKSQEEEKPPNFEPITKNENWLTRKRRLEVNDARAFEAKQQADATEKHWREKNAQQPSDEKIQ